MIPNFQMKKLRCRKVICPKKHIIVVQWAFWEESCLFIILSPECRKYMSLERDSTYIYQISYTCLSLSTNPTHLCNFISQHTYNSCIEHILCVQYSTSISQTVSNLKFKFHFIIRRQTQKSFLYHLAWFWSPQIFILGLNVLQWQDISDPCIIRGHFLILSFSSSILQFSPIQPKG